MVNGSQPREPMVSSFPRLIPTAPDFSAGGTLRARLHLTYVDPLSVPGGQGVAGSNPAVPTQRNSPLITANTEVSGHFHVDACHALSPSISRGWALLPAVGGKRANRPGGPGTMGYATGVSKPRTLGGFRAITG
jgi:hypothetical protein